MIKARWIDLKPLVNKDITTGLIIKAWEIHGIQTRIEWIRFDKLDELAATHCHKLGFDPDTTLMIYEPPRDNPNCDPIIDEIWEEETKNLTLSNYINCVCCFYPNMTLQKLADSMNQVCALKAFL